MAGILVVCTGNICRSPMAEAFLRRALVERLGYAAPPVRSAGVIGRAGASAMPESVHAAAERGANIAPHVVTRLDRALVADADLVVTMAGEHRHEISRLVPGAMRKTFTLKELVRLLERRPPDDTPFDSRAGAAPFDPRAAVARADALRRAESAGPGHDDDVVDPLGMSLDTYRAVAMELDEWCERLAARLAGTAGTRAASAAAATAEGD